MKWNLARISFSRKHVIRLVRDAADLGEGGTKEGYKNTHAVSFQPPSTHKVTRRAPCV